MNQINNEEQVNRKKQLTNTQSQQLLNFNFKKIKSSTCKRLIIDTLLWIEHLHSRFIKFKPNYFNITERNLQLRQSELPLQPTSPLSSQECQQWLTLDRDELIALRIFFSDLIASIRSSQVSIYNELSLNIIIETISQSLQMNQTLQMAYLKDILLTVEQHDQKYSIFCKLIVQEEQLSIRIHDKLKNKRYHYIQSEVLCKSSTIELLSAETFFQIISLQIDFINFINKNTLSYIDTDNYQLVTITLSNHKRKEHKKKAKNMFPNYLKSKQFMEQFLQNQEEYLKLKQKRVKVNGQIKRRGAVFERQVKINQKIREKQLKRDLIKQNLLMKAIQVVDKEQYIEEVNQYNNMITYSVDYLNDRLSKIKLKNFKYQKIDNLVNEKVEVVLLSPQMIASIRNGVQLFSQMDKTALQGVRFYQKGRRQYCFIMKKRKTSQLQY